jgi:hypothetical protein
MNDKKIVFRFFVILITFGVMLAATLLALAMSPGVSIIPGGRIDTAGSIRVFRGMVIILTLLPFAMASAEASHVPHADGSEFGIAESMAVLSFVSALGVALGAATWTWFTVFTFFVNVAIWAKMSSDILMNIFPAVLAQFCPTSISQAS